MITWVIPNQLARSPRPGGSSIPTKVEEVNAWLDEIKQMNVQSIICLLSNQEVNDYYLHVGIDLLELYQDHVREMVHFSIDDYFSAQQRKELLPEIGNFYQRAPKPCLVHCNAGMTRTGTVIDYLLLHHAHPPRS